MVELDGAVAIVYFKDTITKYAIIQTKRGFSLPGGGKEPEDSNLNYTIKRELSEELGLQEKDYSITKTDLIETFVYDSNKEGRAGNVSTKAVFLVELYTPQFNPKDPKILSAKLYTKKEATNIISWPNTLDTFNKGIKII